ncbi:MAG: C13 family peptidase, partial [Verrucomicrobiota bacterium]
ENIHYLSFQPNQDVDGNGLEDDIAYPSTVSNAEQTIRYDIGGPDKLFLYLVDHGSDLQGQGAFRMNAEDDSHLFASELDAWLDELQDNYNTEVTVILEFCYSGSFVDELTYTGSAPRIVVASASADELTWFHVLSQASFSDFFLNAILQGLTVGQAFRLAASAMSPWQQAIMDDTKDGLFLPEEDGLLAGQVHIGPSFVVGRDFPQIGSVSPPRVLETGTTARIWVDDITSVYPIDKVRAVIRPPGYQPDPASGIPIIDLPEIELAYNSARDRYEAVFNGFSQAGVYKISFFAVDIWGGVSFPKQTAVNQTGFDERVILVAGGPTDRSSWSNINVVAN